MYDIGGQLVKKVLKKCLQSNGTSNYKSIYDNWKSWVSVFLNGYILWVFIQHILADVFKLNSFTIQRKRSMLFTKKN